MCGIAGFILKNKSRVNKGEYLKIFKEILHHRGPDDQGEYLNKEFAAVNLRLSIVDLTLGRQPIFNDNHSVGIVFNGEIYNYRRLRKLLIGKGYKFKTNSYTEVILRLYEEFGIESFNKLSGMFAFCIWDDTKNTIYLVRDHFGTKPLYIYEDDQKLIFSSELKGILSLPEIDTTLDILGLQDYLTFRYTLAPYTIFKKIKRLESGSYLEIKGANSAQYRYWDISYQEAYPYISLKNAKEQLVEKMKKSVTSQLMGEVPIGILLSGGIDSSSIAY